MARGKSNLEFEDLFTKYRAHWQTSPESLFATDLCLKHINVLQGRQFIDTELVKILSFLAACYNREKGAFGIDKSKSSPSILATFCAIGILRTLTETPREQRLQLEATEKLLKQSSENFSFPIREIRAFLKSCKKDNGFVDEPNASDESAIPSIESIYMVNYINWNLYHDQTIFDLMTSDPSISGVEERRKQGRINLKKSMVDCFREIRFQVPSTLEATIAGFNPTTHFEALDIGATYFAIRLLTMVDKTLYHEIIPDVGKKQQICRFIFLCWKSTGGFSATIGGTSSLNSTYLCLWLLRHFLEAYLMEPDINLKVLRLKELPSKLEKEYASEILTYLLGDEKLHHIVKFVAECQDGRGFGIAPGFPADPYATERACRVLDLVLSLAKIGHLTEKRYGRLEEAVERLRHLNREVLAFHIEELYTGNGSFRGHPLQAYKPRKEELHNMKYADKFSERLQEKLIHENDLNMDQSLSLSLEAADQYLKTRGKPYTLAADLWQDIEDPDWQEYVVVTYVPYDTAQEAEDVEQEVRKHIIEYLKKSGLAEQRKKIKILLYELQEKKDSVA